MFHTKKNIRSSNEITDLCFDTDKEVPLILNTAENKVSNMKTTLSSCKATCIARLSNTGKVNKINSKITGKIFNNINDLFTVVFNCIRVFKQCVVTQGKDYA